MDKLKIHILRKLYRLTYIGRRHMAVTDLKQGLPKEKRIMRDIEKAVKELVNQGYLISHHTGRISINPRMLKEMKDKIR